MPLAHNHYTPSAAISQPDDGTTSAVVYSHPAAVKVGNPLPSRVLGPCPEGSTNAKIDPLCLTSCRTPRLTLDKNGQELLVGCHEPECVECRRERDLKRFWRVAIELRKIKHDTPILLAKGRFSQAAQGRYSALPDGVVRAAMMTALRAVRRPRTGQRGRSAWPGCSLEYVRSVGVNNGGILNGVHHHHILIKMSPLPEAELPSIKSLKNELLFYYRRELAKGLRFQPLREQMLTRPANHLIYLEPCRDTFASAFYVLCQQEGQFRPGFRRNSMSRGFLQQKGTKNKKATGQKYTEQTQTVAMATRNSRCRTGGDARP